MSFIAKNPISAAQITSSPPTPTKGTRGIFAKEDGWYEIDDKGEITKLGSGSGGTDNLPIKDMSGQTVIPFKDSEPIIAEEGSVVLLDTRDRVYSDDNTLEGTDAIESGNIATGEWSLSMGSKTTATAKNATAMGKETIASGTYSTAMGYKTVASNSMSTSMGRSTEASGKYSVAMGILTQAIGEGSIAEGSNTVSSGMYSHSEGQNTEAIGQASHSEGSYSKATAIASHAEGRSNEANAEGAHAEGRYNKANGMGSHVEGYKTIATCDYQHVQGKHNIEDTENKYAHIVGNGTHTSKRSNAHTLDWAGNAWFAGNVTVGKNTTDNDNDLALVTKGYLMSYINEAISKALSEFVNVAEVGQ